MAAPTITNKASSPLEGISFTTTYTVSATTPEYPAEPFDPGTHALGDNGSEYVFIKASVALKQYQCVALNPTYLACVPATITLVNQQQQLGWPQVAIAASDFGWVCIRGENFGVLAAKGSLPFSVLGPAANPNNKLYISGTSPGVLTTTSVRTSALVTGITLNTSSTSITPNSSVVVANATWPRGIL